MRRSVLGWVALLAPLVGAPALVLAVPADAGDAPAARAQPTTAETEHVYLRDCAWCHGERGQGTPRGPELAGVGRAHTDYMLVTGRMPIDDPEDEVVRAEPAYPPEMIDALVEYVASFGPGGLDIPEVDPARGDLGEGGQIYRLQCAACHEWGGEGGALLRRHAPPLRESDPVVIAEAVRVGPGTMPAFGQAALSDHQLESLVAYVEYLDDPADRGGWALGHFGPLPEGAVAWIFGIGTLLLVIGWIGTRAKDEQ